MTRRKRYSAELKREALRRANEEGVTDVLVAEELGITCSMSGKGSCYDYAVLESFFCITEKRTNQTEKIPQQRRSKNRRVRLHRARLQPKTPTFGLLRTYPH
jgi:transposase InsO family protein